MGVRLVIGTVGGSLLVMSLNIGGWELAVAGFVVLCVAVFPRRFVDPADIPEQDQRQDVAPDGEE